MQKNYESGMFHNKNLRTFPCSDKLKRGGSLMANKQGNTAGNINNNGLVTIQDGWIYFLGVYRVREDGQTGFTVINDDSEGAQGMYLNVVGDWLYYMSQDSGYIYKVRTNKDFENPDSGWERPIKLNSDKSENIIVCNSHIYYINKNDGGKIYKMRTDGTGQQKLNDVQSGFMNVVGDWIYFSNLDESTKNAAGCICKMRTDGSNLEKIGEEAACHLNVVNGWIYYGNASKGHTFWKMRIDGKENLQIKAFEQGSGWNIAGEWVYYHSTGKGGKQRLYKRRLADGSGEKSLCDAVATNINVVGNWVYYMDGSNLPAPGNIFKVMTSGEGHKQLTGGDNPNPIGILIQALQSGNESAMMDAAKLVIGTTNPTMLPQFEQQLNSIPASHRKEMLVEMLEGWIDNSEQERIQAERAEEKKEEKINDTMTMHDKVTTASENDIQKATLIQTFRQKILELGETVYRDDVVLNGLISDIFHNDENLRNALKIAILASIPSKVLGLRTLNETNQELEIMKITQILSVKYSIKEASAKEAVTVFAQGLGLIVDSKGNFAKGVSTPLKSQSIAAQLSTIPQQFTDLAIRQKLNKQRDNIKDAKGKISGLKIEIRKLEMENKESERNKRYWEKEEIDCEYKVEKIDKEIAENARVLGFELAYKSNEATSKNANDNLWNARKKLSEIDASLRNNENKILEHENQLDILNELIYENEEQIRQLETELLKPASQRADEHYDSLILQMNNAINNQNEKELEALTSRFYEMQRYKDSYKLAHECNNIRLKVKQQRIQAERKKAELDAIQKQKETERIAEQRRKDAERNAEKKRKEDEYIAEQKRINAERVAAENEKKYNDLMVQFSKATTESEYAALAVSFEKLGNFKKAKELANECKQQSQRLLKERKKKEQKETYEELLNDYEHATTENDFQSLGKSFRAIYDCEDAIEYAEECERLYHLLKTEREKEEQRKKEMHLMYRNIKEILLYAVPIALHIIAILSYIASGVDETAGMSAGILIIHSIAFAILFFGEGKAIFCFIVIAIWLLISLNSGQWVEQYSFMVLYVLFSAVSSIWAFALGRY